jgi:hypothetical protein
MGRNPVIKLAVEREVDDHFGDGIGHRFSIVIGSR